MRALKKIKNSGTVKLSGLCAMILINISSQAQQNTTQIKGLIKGPDNGPVAFATVMLLSQDSVFVKGEVSKDDGSFVIEGIKPDTYRIKIQNLEYESYLSENFKLDKGESKILPTIKLEKSVTQLDEVVVREKKALVEVHADKMIFNVASSVNASGFNGLELLSKAPGVLIDLDNNIVLQGKSGVRIFINGRPSRLSGTDLVNWLQSIQSDNIESIEIITNPSSRYEAEGNAGIINIRLKKNIDVGYNGSAISNYSKGDYSRYSNGVNLNYRGEKVNIYGDLTKSVNDFQDDLIDTKEQSGFLMDQRSFGLNQNDGYNFSGGIDYSINAKHSLSFVGRGTLTNGSSVSNATTGITDLSGIQSEEILSSVSEAYFKSTNMNYNLNYMYTPSKTSSFSVDMSLGNFSNNTQTYQPNVYFESDASTPIKEINNLFDANNEISLWSIQTDYEKSFENFTLSAGGKYSYINTDNLFAFYNIESGISTLDINRSNYFTYLEKVTSLYMIFNAKLSKKIKMNAGLRMENTSSSAILESQVTIQDSQVDRAYTNLFPNISISYNDQKNSQLSFNVGRRISRPGYQSLNPFENKLSELVSFKGNPFLKPNYTMNYQITYSYKSKLVISNTYGVTTDDFSTIMQIVDSKGTFFIPQNMQKSTTNGLSISYPVELTKWWELTTFINYNYSTYNGQFENTVIALNASIFNFRIQNNLSLPADFKLEISYSYNSPWIWRNSIEVEENSNLSVGVRKGFFDSRLQVRISANDIFNNSSDYPYHGNYGGIIINGVRSFDNRRLVAGLTFKFGNQKIKSSKKKKSALDDELNRLRTTD